MIPVKIFPCTANSNKGDFHIQRTDTGEFWGHTSPAIDAPLDWVTGESNARYYNEEKDETTPQAEIAKHSDWQLVTK